MEGEASPEESFRLARHLPDCTSCRILLAREKRLATVLDGLEDTGNEDAGLLDRVMSALGKRPAPRRPTRGERTGLPRRGLRLVAFLVAVMAAESVRGGLHAIRWGGWSWTPTAPTADSWPDLARSFGGSAAALLASVRDGGFVLSLELPSLAVVMGGASAVCVLATGLFGLFALVTAAGLRRRVSEA